MSEVCVLSCEVVFSATFVFQKRGLCGFVKFFFGFRAIFLRKSLAVRWDVRTFASAFAPKTGFTPWGAGMFFERFS